MSRLSGLFSLLEFLNILLGSQEPQEKGHFQAQAPSPPQRRTEMITCPTFLPRALHTPRLGPPRQIGLQDTGSESHLPCLCVQPITCLVRNFSRVHSFLEELRTWFRDLPASQVMSTVRRQKGRLVILRHIQGNQH